VVQVADTLGRVEELWGHGTCADAPAKLDLILEHRVRSRHSANGRNGWKAAIQLAPRRRLIIPRLKAAPKPTSMHMRTITT
jgi:hypothetical protein